MANEDEMQEQEELNEAKADLTAQNNARQLNARMLISRRSEIHRSKGLAEDGGEEMTGVDDGIPDDDLAGGTTDAYPYQVTDDAIKTALAGLPKATDSRPEAPRTHKIKVNGKEIELTDEELIARAQKVEAADQYLAQAKRKSEQAVPSAKPADAPPADTVTDDDLALARALQVGSEEDAARAIAAIRGRQSRSPSVNTDEVVHKVKADMEFQENAKWFAETYPEIFADPDYLTIAIKRDAELMEKDKQEGTVTSYKDRYSRIGDDLRKKFGIDPAYSAKTAKKKETLTSIPTAHTKVRMPEPEDDSEESPASVIAKMAASRGQLRI
jgi:hypothetical protein